MPGMLRKSTSFVPRYRKFESISLQRRVVRTPVRTSKAGGSGGATTRAQNAAVQVSSRRPTLLSMHAAVHNTFNLPVGKIGLGAVVLGRFDRPQRSLASPVARNGVLS